MRGATHHNNAHRMLAATSITNPGRKTKEMKPDIEVQGEAIIKALRVLNPQLADELNKWQIIPDLDLNPGVPLQIVNRYETESYSFGPKGMDIHEGEVDEVERPSFEDAHHYVFPGTLQFIVDAVSLLEALAEKGAAK